VELAKHASNNAKTKIAPEIEQNSCDWKNSKNENKTSLSKIMISN